MDFDLVGLEQGPPDGGEVAEVTLDLLLQVQRPDVLVERAQHTSGVGAVLALVPLRGDLGVLDPHVGHEVPVAHTPVVAQVAPDGVRQALVNLQPMLTPVSCSLVRVRLILR